MPIDDLFLLPGSSRRDAQVEAWFGGTDPLRLMMRPWFDLMRGLGDDVRETLHDHQPTACVGDAAFGYVNVFTAHVNVGFFRGAELPDPRGLLQGTGRFMRHVKLRPGALGSVVTIIDADALGALIRIAYTDMRQRLAAG